METRQSLEGTLAKLGFDPAHDLELAPLLNELHYQPETEVVPNSSPPPAVQRRLACWRPLRRHGKLRLGHGLPDLLEAWDWTRQLWEDDGECNVGKEA